MLFKYTATQPEGGRKEGQMEAANMEIAVRALQKRYLIVVSIVPVSEKWFLFKKFEMMGRVKKKDMVIFSRQLSTLFEAKVPVLSSFTLLASESDNPILKDVLLKVMEDIKSGTNISEALSAHPKIFSGFYVNMIKAGEESGKLEEVFKYLADYLERSYELSSRAVKALIYPAFVIAAFVGVIALMLTVVIPKLSSIIEESGQDVPLYTKVVMALSDFLIAYGFIILIFFALGGLALWRYLKTNAGKIFISKLQISVPLIGKLYKEIYLSRITDNMETLITGGVSMIKSLQITADTTENYVYKFILHETIEAVKGGANISESFGRYKEIPRLVTQMIRIGEETGKLDFILKTVAKFYKGEVDRTLDTLVSLIEPILMVVLGVGVGFLLASVLIPIYNIAMSV